MKAANSWARVAGGRLFLALLLTATLAPTWRIRAQPVPSGTLAAIAERGAIRLGFRDNAVPFAFPDQAGRPVGFAVDLCTEIAADVAAALGRPLRRPGEQGPGLRIEASTVTAEQRLPLVTAGDIDLECGSTTATLVRAKVVAFSPVFFLAGTRLLVTADSTVSDYRDLAGRTVAAAVGTTNNAVVRGLGARLSPPIEVTDVPDLPSGLALLAGGKVAALASDDVLLAGLLLQQRQPGRFRMAGDFMSYEPYALVLRRDDPAFAALVLASFRRMAVSGILADRYRRWFGGRLPNGQVLDLPLSPQLDELYKALGAP